MGWIPLGRDDKKPCGKKRRKYNRMKRTFSKLAVLAGRHFTSDRPMPRTAPLSEDELAALAEDDWLAGELHTKCEFPALKKGEQ